MESTDQNLKIVEQLQKYFNAEIIGSYLLVKEGFLDINHINDIDLQIPEENLSNAYKFMADNGYTQTVLKGRQIGYENGKSIHEQIYKGDFKNDKGFRIDITEKKTSVYSIPTLIAEKFKRGKLEDFCQLQIICLKNTEIDLIKLLHYKNTTVGLYAIEKNPKEVSKDWIDKNSFQIKY